MSSSSKSSTTNNDSRNEDPSDPNFDSRDHYLQQEIRKTKSLIEKFRFEKAQFDVYLARWQKNGWPVAQLMRDHYGSKILDDNNVFQLMSFYKHEIIFDEDKGLMLNYKGKQ
jgi:hypothetical protein